MLLVGDIGGTHARLAWATRCGERILLQGIRVLPSRDFDGIASLLDRFLASCPSHETLRAVCLGVPAPADGSVVRLTNLPWVIDGPVLSARFGVPLKLLNDVEAAAWGLASLDRDQLLTLQAGGGRKPSSGEDYDQTEAGCDAGRGAVEASSPTRRVLIAPGTGLGEAVVCWDGVRWQCAPTEGGHTDFGPADDEQLALWRHLRGLYSHVSYERIISGPGLVELCRFHRDRLGELDRPWPDGVDPAAAIAQAAATGTERAALAAVRSWCRILGAEAGNLALSFLARGGVFIAGGMAPKLRVFVEGPELLEGFRAKGRYRELMSTIPVHLVLDPTLALRGAALAAEAQVF